MSSEPTSYEWIRNAINQPDKRISQCLYNHTCNPNINQSLEKCRYAKQEEEEEEAAAATKTES